jgi:hypothetical protein
MDAWTSPITEHIGLLGVAGFVILLLIGITARIVWSRSTARNEDSTRSENVLGAIGGPSTYRAVRKLK